MVVELEMEENSKPEIQKTEFVWMNGKTIAWEDGNIPLMTHALHYGTGVFEGIRGYGPWIPISIFSASKIISRGSSIRRGFATLRQSILLAN